MPDLKNRIKKFVAWAVRIDSFSRFARALYLFGSYAHVERQKVLAERHPGIKAQDISPDLRVLHGPFRGMRYPKAEASYSALLPKLLGSYERELHPVLERIVSEQYSIIADVGCAEGYYAVGFLLRQPNATVFAFDTSEQATALCEEMARLNGVDQRLVTAGTCDPQALMEILSKHEGRALIMSDCEGYEKHLFSPELKPYLAQHDLLIEVHDLIDIEISGYLRQMFSDTHTLREIASVDDVLKVRTYEYAELDSYGLRQRKAILSEFRNGHMEWFYFTPKSRRSSDDLVNSDQTIPHLHEEGSVG
jgi:hypothetical protein